MSGGGGRLGCVFVFTIGEVGVEVVVHGVPVVVVVVVVYRTYYSRR